MKATFPIEQYKEVIKEYNALEAIKFDPNEDRESIIQKLEERSLRKRELANIANTIIQEYIEPFEKNPELLDDESVSNLEKFSLLLYPDGAVVGRVTETDHAIVYRIEKILCNYYKGTDDINKYAFSVNRRSLGHMLLYNGHSYSIIDSPFKDEAFDLARKIDSGLFDDKGRMKVLMAIVREGITSESHFIIDQYQEVLDTVLSHMSEPANPYEIYNLFFFLNMVMQQFREYNIWAKDNGIKVDVEAARPVINNVINAYLDLLKNNPSLDTVGDTNADLKITEFFLNNITLDELLEVLTNLQSKSAAQDNPIIQAQGLGMYNNYYLNILYRFSNLPKDEIIRISKERIKDVQPQLMNVSHQVNNFIFNRYIVEFLNAASLTGSFDEFREIILECTVYADKPLFIHTTMVKEMSLVIFDYMIKNNPEVFNGVAGKDIKYIKEHVEEMKELLSDCCMFHDIGKFFMLDLVENSMRKLTDDEFNIIKDHPKHFEHIFQVMDNDDERLGCIHDCALTHHLWHDGTKGYPNVKQTKNRPFSDIIAITDSIDAATDFFGRSYNNGKSIDELIKEFQDASGTKYGPDAVKALSNKEVRDKLHYWITEGRKDINYRIYAFNKL